MIDLANSPAAILEEYIQKKGGWVSSYKELLKSTYPYHTQER
jgi:hypothetical protein